MRGSVWHAGSAVRIASALSLVVALLTLARTSHALASITSFDPVRGPVGATIHVTGSGFTDALAVRLGGLDASFSVPADDQLDLVVPPGATTGLLEVDTPDGTASSTEPFVVLPNILAILSDDQRWDTVAEMPTVQAELVGEGVLFSNGFVTNPVCCPSRAAFLTGLYSRHTNVWTNAPPYGGFEAFDDSVSIATALDSAGYATALFGKYLNHYAMTDGAYVPPGWDRWRAFASTTGYFDYSISLDGVSAEEHGSNEEDYSTDVLAAHAEDFIVGASAQDPLFVWFAPLAPHGPFIAAPRHAGSRAGVEPWRPPSYDEPDVSDKPAYIQEEPRFSTERMAEIDLLRQTQLGMLASLDEAVGRILTALETAGRLGDTLIIYSSDNGYLWGEYRRIAKVVPYEESIRVPFVVRWDRLGTAPRTDGHFVQNIDVAPTVAAAAGVSLPVVDGMSLLPLLSGTATSWRPRLFFEHTGEGEVVYCAIRTAKAKLIHNASGEEEYYRLKADPYEEKNKIGTPRLQDSIAALRDMLRSWCDPPPPEMEPF
jgi:arylsulfatase A-like enzyme